MLGQPCIDLRQKHQPFDGIVERRIRWQIFERPQNPFADSSFSHDQFYRVPKQPSSNIGASRQPMIASTKKRML